MTLTGGMEDSQRSEFLEREIETYRTDDGLSHSPVWIWFSKVNETELHCLVCNKRTPRGKDGSTGGMLFHIKSKHGPRSFYDAYTIFEELAELRDLRLMAKRQNNVGRRPRTSNSATGVKRRRKPHPEIGTKELTENLTTTGTEPDAEDLFADEEDDIDFGKSFLKKCTHCERARGP